ncbi:MAG: winged helix-turn-helix domain-containing protein [Chloroflexi bacterium]|nr:winged helix-turn-helix domain-containing protein [Chloroflexota bacterium]
MATAERLALLSSDGAFVVDQALRIVAWNQAAEALMGYRPDEVVGQSCYKVLAAVTQDLKPICTPQCAGLHCFQQGCPYSARAALCRTKDGRRVLASISSLLLPEELRKEGALALIFLRPVESPSSPGHADQTLQAYTLGRFQVYRGGVEVPIRGWRRQQAVTVLKYLVTHRGRPVHREALLELLWPDISLESGRQRLKVVLYALRKGLGNSPAQETPSYLVNEGDCVVLATSSLWVDADSFETLYQRGRQQEREGSLDQAITSYTQARTLYRGDYLEEERYTDWCSLEQERLKELYLTLLVRLAHLYGTSGGYEEAASACREALLRDSCRESIHRDLMTYLWKAGRMAEAVNQYALCRQILSQQIGVEPMPETQSLYERILAQGMPSR